MKILLLLACVLVTGCAQIGSVGVHGSYENEQGQTFSGGVDIGLRDGKTVKPIHR